MSIAPGRTVIPRGAEHERAHDDPASGSEPVLACRAPFTSLHIDQFGDARPCCQSTRVLGNIATDTIDDIWTSDSLAQLRTAITDGDLTLGCDHCAWSGRDGRETTYAVRFDRDRLPAPTEGPTRLELAPSNACNLQCTMCNGDWSSSIRLHREQRPALPRRFGDDQLAQVEALAPGLDQIHLFGGEPLLMPEALRLLDIAAATGTRCTITTNGSICTPRVEALLDRPGVDLVVSVDGTSPEVYEAIRCGADWTTLNRNLDTFQHLARRNGNTVDLAHCLMTTNWHEFPDHLTWAAHRHLGVYVNDVVSPVEASLHQLTPPELHAVLDQLEARQPEVDRLPPPWRVTWEKALTGLRHTLHDTDDGTRHRRLGAGTVRSTDLGEPGSRDGESRVDLIERMLSYQVSVRVDLDEHLRVTDVTTEGNVDRFPHIDLGSLVGRPSGEVRTLVDWGGRPQSHLVSRWDPAHASEQRRFADDLDALAEYRTTTAGARSIRFDYRLPSAKDERLAALAVLTGTDDVVTMQVDADGTLVAIGPADHAAELGLLTDVGKPCRSPLDVLAPDRADPAPAVEVTEVRPDVILVDLTWDDGSALVALTLVNEDGADVCLARPQR